MKIRDRYTGGVAGSGPVRGQGKAPEAAEAGRGPGSADRVQISPRSVDIGRARAAALQAPDIRQVLVEEIVGMIDRGEYAVTGAEVAPKMIREHMMDAVG